MYTPKEKPSFFRGGLIHACIQMKRKLSLHKVSVTCCVINDNRIPFSCLHFHEFKVWQRINLYKYIQIL